MKKAIEEILWHCTTLKDKNNDYHHRFCPLGQLTWCEYQKHKLTGKTRYENKLNIMEI